MGVWVLVSVLRVVGVKYFTATKMRDFERRLNRVKDGLHQKKSELDLVKSRQAQISADETLHSERIRSMKELIHDIQLRLQTKDETPDDMEIEGFPLRR